MTVTAIGDGIYRVSDGARTWTVAIAGPPENRWVWIDGHVTRLEGGAAGRSRRRTATDELSAPMPATVVKVLVEPGATVTKGQTLVMLDAMKMELPVRAPADGRVTAVHCRPGELVQPGVQLIECEAIDPRAGDEER